MSGFKRSEGRTFPPIIALEDKEVVVAAITDIRKETGRFNSTVVDLVTLGGVEFSLNGHAILVDMLEEQLQEHRNIFRIEPEGLVGRARGYTVDCWDGTADTLRKDPAGKKLIASTEKLVEAKIAELPPRD